MEEIINKLHEAYEVAIDKACKLQDLFGSEELITVAAFHDAYGLEKAFKIVAGMTITEYLIEKHKALFENERR